MLCPSIILLICGWSVEHYMFRGWDVCVGWSACPFAWNGFRGYVVVSLVSMDCLVLW